jgi:hypothetical protein
MKGQETLELCVPLSDNGQQWHKSLGFKLEEFCGECAERKAIGLSIVVGV